MPMRSTCLILFSALTLLAACASGPATQTESAPATAPAAKQAPAPTYYSGAVMTTSPDGEQPLGPPVKVLAKRQLLPAENKIVEEVWHSGRHIVTTLLRKEGGLFSASDAGGSFSGTLTFSGDDWDWSAWTYDIQLSDGSGKISGRGAKTDEGRLIIEKLFIDAAGAPKARILEDHKAISPEEFQELLQALPPQKG